MEVWRRWWSWAIVALFVLLVALGVGLWSSLRMAGQTDIALGTVAQIGDSKERITAYKELAQYQVDGQVKV